MSIKRSWRLGVLSVLFCSLFIISCGNKDENLDKIEGIKLNKGSLIETENGSYHNYNFENGKYTKLDKEEVIGLYDYKSGNYIAQKGEKYIAFYDGKIVDLNIIETGDQGLNISPGGQYLSFYKEIEGIRNYRIISLKSGEFIDFNTTTAISGDLLDWLDDNSLVYYGVSEEGINGVFKQNISEGKEELIYKLDGGIVQFLKSNDNGVVILQENINNKKILQVIDNNTGEIRTISDEVARVYDVVNSGDDYYLLGELKGDGTSVYKLSNGKGKRLIFDFPKNLKLTKYGLSLDETGNVLFIGSNLEVSLQEVYSIADDGTIKKISDSKSEYNFVK